MKSLIITAITLFNAIAMNIGTKREAVKAPVNGGNETENLGLLFEYAERIKMVHVSLNAIDEMVSHVMRKWQTGHEAIP